MAQALQLAAFVQEVASHLQPHGIDVELLTGGDARPGLLSCRRPDTGRTVFLLAMPVECSRARAEVLADYAKQELPHA
jgi:hypothetical protein